MSWMVKSLWCDSWHRQSGQAMKLQTHHHLGIARDIFISSHVFMGGIGMLLVSCEHESCMKWVIRYSPGINLNRLR